MPSERSEREKGRTLRWELYGEPPARTPPAGRGTRGTDRRWRGRRAARPWATRSPSSGDPPPRYPAPSCTLASGSTFRSNTKNDSKKLRKAASFPPLPASSFPHNPSAGAGRAQEATGGATEVVAWIQVGIFARTEPVAEIKIWSLGHGKGTRDLVMASSSCGRRSSSRREGKSMATWESLLEFEMAWLAGCVLLPYGLERDKYTIL